MWVFRSLPYHKQHVQLIRPDRRMYVMRKRGCSPQVVRDASRVRPESGL